MKSKRVMREVKAERPIGYSKRVLPLIVYWFLNFMKLNNKFAVF
jgi:hypothetical protein